MGFKGANKVNRGLLKYFRGLIEVFRSLLESLWAYLKAYYLQSVFKQFFKDSASNEVEYIGFFSQMGLI